LTKKNFYVSNASMPRILAATSASSYADFRNTYLSPQLVLREPADFHDPIPISERLVQALWNDQLFDTTQLKTVCGRSLQIIHPGKWSREGGPDFTSAQAIINGETFQGDIEIHLHSSGWKEHRHSENAAYGQVILDVCLWKIDDAPPIRCDGFRIFQLVLHPYLQSSIDELVESLDPDYYPFSPKQIQNRRSPLNKLPKTELAGYIESAGIFRLEQKIARIKSILESHGPEQTAYVLIAEALGYKHNKWTFRQIAEHCPITQLRKIISIDEKLEKLFSQLDHIPLRTAQVRPNNHPERRLATLALLAHEHPDLTIWFSELLNSRFISRAPSLKHPFWSWHYHRRSKKSAKPIALLGKERWQDILVNVILPFGIVAARQRKEAEAESNLLALYLNLPCIQQSLPAKQISYDLGVSQPKKTVQQQGLIQIYQDFNLRHSD
jgi:hypothetical protein